MGQIRGTLRPCRDFVGLGQCGENPGEWESCTSTPRADRCNIAIHSEGQQVAPVKPNDREKNMNRLCLALNKQVILSV